MKGKIAKKTKRKGKAVAKKEWLLMERRCESSTKYMAKKAMEDQQRM